MHLLSDIPTGLTKQQNGKLETELDWMTKVVPVPARKLLSGRSKMYLFKLRSSLDEMPVLSNQVIPRREANSRHKPRSKESQELSPKS